MNGPRPLTLFLRVILPLVIGACSGSPTGRAATGCLVVGYDKSREMYRGTVRNGVPIGEWRLLDPIGREVWAGEICAGKPCGDKWEEKELLRYEQFPLVDASGRLVCLYRDRGGTIGGGICAANTLTAPGLNFPIKDECGHE